MFWTTARRAWDSPFLERSSIITGFNNNCPLCLGFTIFRSTGIAWSCVNNLFCILLESLTDLSSHVQHGYLPRQVHAFRCGLFAFWLSGEVQLCTELTERVSRQQGRDLTTEGLWAWSRRLHVWVDVSKGFNCWSVTSPTSPHWSLISCVLPSLGRFGSSAGLCPFSVGLRFFSLAFSGFARSGPGVLVLVFSPSPLLFAFPFSCPG